jgi:hypothetical protein
MSYNPPPPPFDPNAGQRPLYGQDPYGQGPYGQPQQPDPYNPYGQPAQQQPVGYQQPPQLPPMGQQPYPQMPPPTPTQGKRGRVIGILTAIGLIVLIGVVRVVVFKGADKVYHSATDADRNKTGEVTESGNLDPVALKNGDCFHNGISSTTTTETVTNIDAIPCTGRHDAQVVAMFSLPGGTYPLTAKFESLCHAKIQKWVKTNPSETKILTKLDPKWGSTYLFPTPALWAKGDHKVTCNIVMNSNVLTRKIPVLH